MAIPKITDRIDQLCDLLNVLGGTIDGRKKFQKIVFIASELNKLPNKYRDFNWNYYGVYSYELAHDIDIANRLNYLKEEDDEAGYIYELTKKGTEIDHNLQLPENLISIFTENNSRFLEVLSSIVYFARKTPNDEEIKNKLHKFKGHLKSYFDDAFATYHELKSI